MSLVAQIMYGCKNVGYMCWPSTTATYGDFIRVTDN